MKESQLNKIRNPAFRDGRTRPRDWSFVTDESATRWTRPPHDDKASPVGVAILCAVGAGFSGFQQDVTCRAGHYYRLDATVRARLSGPRPPDFNAGGAVLAVIPRHGDRAVGPRRVTPAVGTADGPVVLRTYVRAPDDARRLRVQVGLENAAGVLEIEHVRLFDILEPEEESHVLALPPPAGAAPPPARVKRLGLVTEQFIDGEWHERLRAFFGPEGVETFAPHDWSADGRSRCDAWIFPDQTPPRGIRSLAALFALAEHCLVIVSPAGFAGLCGRNVSLRCVEQADDPIHARIEYAHHGSRGFALHDCFPFAAAGRTIGSFAQEQFRKTATFDRFCRKHGFVTLLSSLCNRESTSFQPIALYKETAGGGLYVMDCRPLNEPMSTMAEAVPAVHFLLAILGRAPGGLGQYVVPERSEARLRDLIRELGVRFAPVRVDDDNLPVDEIRRQVVMIGGDDRSFGLPLAKRPTILIRSGLVSGDAESVYGSFLWVKQLVRMPPHVCPYAAALLAKFRVVWEPCAAAWEGKEGWRRSGLATADSAGIALAQHGGELLHAVVDVVSRPIDQVRVVLASAGDISQRLRRWLGPLSAAFGPAAHFLPAAREITAFTGEAGKPWQIAAFPVSTCVDEPSFDTGLRECARAELIRLEVPGGDADFAACSIQRTDAVATTLEHVIGLLYGLLAVNRTDVTANFDGFPPVPPGEALIFNDSAPILRQATVQAG